MKLDFWTIAFIVMLLCGGGYWIQKVSAEKKEAARIAYEMHMAELKRAEQAKTALPLLKNFIAAEEKKLEKSI